MGTSRRRPLSERSRRPAKAPTALAVVAILSVVIGALSAASSLDDPVGFVMNAFLVVVGICLLTGQRWARLAGIIVYALSAAVLSVTAILALVAASQAPSAAFLVLAILVLPAAFSIWAITVLSSRPVKQHFGG